MAQELTEEAVGATIHTPDGDSIGSVTRVAEGVGYVEPDSEAPDTVLATLGWDAVEPDDGAYPLPRTAIDTVEDGAIHLHRGDEDADRSDEAEHDPDADLTRSSDGETNERSEEAEEARERAREADAERDVEESIEREAAAHESSNPDAHRDEEPFNS